MIALIQQLKATNLFIENYFYKSNKLLIILKFNDLSYVLSTLSVTKAWSF